MLKRLKNKTTWKKPNFRSFDFTFVSIAICWLGYYDSVTTGGGWAKCTHDLTAIVCDHSALKIKKIFRNVDPASRSHTAGLLRDWHVYSLLYVLLHIYTLSRRPDRVRGKGRP